jgi:hypothetical protein
VIGSLIDWWRRRRVTRARFPHVVWVARRSELPDLPDRRVITIVGHPENPQWAVFACPCGHGHLIALNLSPRRRPVWRIEGGSSTPSIFPSVDSVWEGRRCHFWVRAGAVSWTRDSITEVMTNDG